MLLFFLIQPFLKLHTHLRFFTKVEAKVINLQTKHCKILISVFLYHNISDVTLFTMHSSSNKGSVDYIILFPCMMVLTVPMCCFGLHLLCSSMTSVILFNIVLYINTMDAVLTLM